MTPISERLRTTWPRLPNSPVTDGQRAIIHEAADIIDALVEELMVAADAVEGSITDLDEAICCSGYMCGCRGSSNRELLVHGLRAAIARARGAA